MILDQSAVTKLKLQDKVSMIPPGVQKPHGGPSGGETEEVYKQRLFDWLVQLAGEAPMKGTRKYVLRAWCLEQSVSVATPVTPISTPDFKKIF
jgi:hypothetical protein